MCIFIHCPSQSPTFPKFRELKQHLLIEPNLLANKLVLVKRPYAKPAMTGAFSK
jgi:hypothetical protein